MKLLHVAVAAILNFVWFKSLVLLKELLTSFMVLKIYYIIVITDMMQFIATPINSVHCFYLASLHNTEKNGFLE